MTFRQIYTRGITKGLCQEGVRLRLVWFNAARDGKTGDEINQAMSEFTAHKSQCDFCKPFWLRSDEPRPDTEGR